MTATVIHSARLVSHGVASDDAWIRFEDSAIVGTGTGTTWTAADTVVDAAEIAGPGAILAPGFIDIHGHGGAGASYDDGVEAIRTARALHRAHGTTRAVISLVTASVDDLARRVGEIAELTDTDAEILGSHLEGPFLDPGHQGAHEPSLLRAPDAADLRRL
ncbi:MAG TPA: N-acetylglucosamine-6-phosphate deacetylase, partial [Microbacterium sp.]|nr:N-acetylglucosamine-6-phosphate deacetylase [Microbacterium sp.]